MYVALGAESAVAYRGEPHVAVASFQAGLNQDLAAKGCHTIDTDGVLGPGTCGAGDYVLRNITPQSPATQVGQWVMQYCEGSTTYSCKAPGGGGGGGGAVLPYDPGTLPGSGGGAVSQSNLIVGGLLLATVGVVGYAIAKKKGMVK